MKKLVLGFAAALLCVAFVATEAEAAKRLGGARSVGTQRNVTNAPPAAAPGQAGAGAADAAVRRACRGAAAAGQRISRWAPLLGGLALGGALGWLMGANGMGGLMVGLLLVGLLVFAGDLRRAHADAEARRGAAAHAVRRHGQRNRRGAAAFAGGRLRRASRALRRRRERSRRLRCRRLPARRQAQLHEAADRQRPGQPGGTARIHHATSCSRS